MRRPPGPSPFPVPRRPRGRWAWHERVLRGLRRRCLLDRLAGLRVALAELAAPSGRPRRGTEPPLSFMVALLAEEADPLAELDDALERLQDGRYGRCEATGCVIPEARLRAAPWLRTLGPVADGRRPAGSVARR